MSQASFLWDMTNSAYPDQTPRFAASDQGIQYLLIQVCSIQRIKMNQPKTLTTEIMWKFHWA